MNNQNQNGNLALTASPVPALKESKQSQSKLDELLAGCFTLQKMYGRAPDSLETVALLFHNMLGKYPADKVIKAFELWLERSQEFPTPADIVGLLRRNGKPPLSKERYIAISKKDGQDRTPDDWQYMREYEKEQDTEEWGTEIVDEIKDSSTLQENIRLRTELRELRAEYGRLSELLRQERQKIPSLLPEVPLNDRVQRTIDAMRQGGAPQEDIDEFLKQYGSAA